MPELPEVETTLRGIQPLILNIKISQIVVRRPDLRWPVPVKEITQALKGNSFFDIRRRGKYLILTSNKGSLLIHLGMSGCLRIFPEHVRPQKHDHLDIIFKNGNLLRFTDPRRFGSFLWSKEPDKHHLIRNLGPEPLEDSFSGQYLFKQSRDREVAIKNFIMNSKIVVGLGNIYASEALFNAGLRPQRKACKTTLAQAEFLCSSIKTLLKESINQGGTTLRDFVGSNNNPGYFKQQLKVYGRKNKKCKSCSTLLKEIRIGQRSSVYCPRCQV